MLYKTLFVLSIIAVFAGALFTTNGPSQPFSPQAPSFDNPFSAGKTSTSEWEVTSTNWTPSVFNPNWTFTPNSTYGNDHGCSFSSYWNCINDPNGPDINTSVYIDFGKTIMANPRSLVVNMTVPMPYKYLSSLIFNIRCSTPYPFTPFIITAAVQTWSTPIAISMTSLKCSNSGGFSFKLSSVKMGFWGNNGIDLSTLTDFLHNQLYLFVQLDSFIQTSFAPNVLFPNYPINITTITIDATYIDKNPNTCASTDQLCQFLTFIAVFTNAVVFLFNGIIWFIIMLGIIAQLVMNYISIIAWLYNIPGVPTIIQVYIDAILTTWIVIISVELFKIIKPFGGS